MNKGKPISGKIYSLTGGPGTPSIASGNTWAESETKLYQVKLLKTDKSGGFFKTLKEALSKQKKYETTLQTNHLINDYEQKKYQLNPSFRFIV